jgi:hypothetical protein
VWIEPVIAQLMMTLFAMVGSSFASHDVQHAAKTVKSFSQIPATNPSPTARAQPQPVAARARRGADAANLSVIG